MRQIRVSKIVNLYSFSELSKIAKERASVLSGLDEFKDNSEQLKNELFYQDGIPYCPPGTKEIHEFIN